MNNNDSWCPLPWLHQFIQPDGIKTCCQGKQIEKTNPSKFFNSELVVSVRQSILKNEIHQNCTNCFHLENQGFKSIRQESIEFYKDYSINNLPQHGLEYLDLRYNNQCNFSCRTCEPSFSSSIVNEIEKNPVLKKYYRSVKKENSYDKIADDLIEILPQVKRINFTGGEPVLIKDNLKILEELIKHKKFDCEILITTNASVINPQWLTLVKNFTTVHWTVSIDGVESFAEYIRYGTNWNTVKKNIHSILKLGHSVAFNTVLSAYSVLDLDKLVSFFIECKKISQGPLELLFHTCTHPAYLSPAVLDDNLNQIARKKINDAVQLLSSVTDNPEASIQTLKNCLRILNTSNELNRIKFIEFTNDMDQIRNQNFYKLVQGI